jgi:hypothetical protein
MQEKDAGLKQSVPFHDWINNSKAVTTTPSSLSTSDIYCRAVHIRALAANTGVVYIGGTGDVLSATNAPIALSATDEVDIEIDNPKNVYVLSSTGTQNLAWAYLR